MNDPILAFAEQWNQSKPVLHWPILYARDREHFTLPDSQAINAAMEAYPLTDAAWDQLAETPPRSLVHAGNAILRWKALYLPVV